MDDYYEPWTYDYLNLFNAPEGSDQPTAEPISMIDGEKIDVQSGPNWDDDLGGSPIYAENDPNLKGLTEQQHLQLSSVERLVFFYLPRICNHCLNPVCVASCPSGAHYKRGEDGIVLIDQKKCRAWRSCVSACPYKKTYFNWFTGTDIWGGRIVYGLLLLCCALPMYLTSYCNGYWQFFVAGLGCGFCGTSFAVGIAYTSVWFPQHQQGTALGIFGAGNAGAALTSFGAPTVLNWLTNDGRNIEGRRHLPKIYAAMLAVTGVLFLLTTTTRLHAGSATKTLPQGLEPLCHLRVWRFGLYYFFVFCGFVALAQWLVPNYVNAYSTTVVLAGMLAACNSLPSGVIRAVGGWLSDKLGARTVMYWVLGTSFVCCILLIVPQMDIHSPGSGGMARGGGEVLSVSETEIVVQSETGQPRTYEIKRKIGELVSEEELKSGMMVFPRIASWQEAAVEPSQKISNKQLLARGVTQIFFQANIWIITGLSLILGAVMGVGKAAVYKHIPDYFPNDVGVVGGIVGMLGGLGGFVCPVIFGYLLNATGLWTSCWMFFAVLIILCLSWMHVVIHRMLSREAPELTHRI